MPQNRPPVLAQQNFRRHRSRFTGLDLAERFALIHELNLWGAPTSRSGVGSELDETAALRADLSKMLDSLNVETLLDAPCGDFGWLQAVDFGTRRYIGVDVVPTIINELRQRFHSPESQRTFEIANVVQDPLPPADAILCRDCLVHLSFLNISRTIENFRTTGARWLMTTTFTELDENYDIEDGDWRPINLEIAPFFWPLPHSVLNEQCDELDGAYRDKSLGVWRLSELPV